MSAPKRHYGPYVRTRRDLIRRGWLMALLGLVVGCVLAFAVAILVGINTENVDAVMVRTTIEDTEAANGVCPENIGYVTDMYGFALYTFASCGDDFVIVTAGGGRYDLENVGRTLVDIANTGEYEVIGERINIKMGDADITLWIELLDRFG